MLTLLVLPMLAAQAGAQSVRDTAPPIQTQNETLTPAEQRADVLDGLFAELHRSSAGRAPRIQESIWKLWSSSDSPTADLLLQQGTQAMGARQYDEAMEIFNRVIAAYPDYAEPWNKRATLNFIMGREAASLADIDRVLELEPRHFGALSGRGMIYRNQKKYSLAVEAFREALAINPTLQTLKDAIAEIEKIERGI